MQISCILIRFVPFMKHEQLPMIKMQSTELKLKKPPHHISKKVLKQKHNNNGHIE